MVWSIETDQTFPLASVKPLDRLQRYREQCLSETRKACAAPTRRRDVSPVSGQRLVPFGAVDGLEYLRCEQSGSLFLAEVPPPEAWAQLLSRLMRYRHSPEAFHAGLAGARTEHVYTPKLEWLLTTLRMQGLEQLPLLEVTTPPSDFTALLTESGAFARVVTVNEMELAHAAARADGGRYGAAVLLESLDRVDEPAGLLSAVVERLAPGGLFFVTALVSSGFDLAVLGLNNRYLYPPDRTNCFSLQGLEQLLRNHGLTLLEVSTPGVLDVEIVQAHCQQVPGIPLSGFERQLLAASPQTLEAFQSFLQQHRMSSFARIIGQKEGA